MSASDAGATKINDYWANIASMRPRHVCLGCLATEITMGGKLLLLQ